MKQKNPIQMENEDTEGYIVKGQGNNRDHSKEFTGSRAPHR